MFKNKKKINQYIIAGVFILAILALEYVGYQFYFTDQEIKENVEWLETAALELEDENIFLADKLLSEQQKNGMFETKIKEIAGTVGTLDKLSKTDKELLQKYSKIYFLNEHYVPERLEQIPEGYIYEVEKEMQIHAKVLPYLTDMMKTAEKEGIDLKIISAYRSFGEQSILKIGYTVSYGSGANKFSADQGYSEHQLGTTVDFTTSKTGTSFSKFKDTESFEWLTKNAHRYGFILSYPENNSYYQFEPWHFRFVGKSLAGRLFEEKQYFYDLEQRAIDAYLINIFD